MQTTFTPTNARKNFFEILKYVATENEPITIQQKNQDLDAVIISKKDWDAISETMYLHSTGTMAKVMEREHDDSGFVDLVDIDWDSL